MANATAEAGQKQKANSKNISFYLLSIRDLMIKYTLAGKAQIAGMIVKIVIFS